MLMDYLHKNPEVKIRYKASNMKLYVNSDAAYLIAPRAKSRIAGYFYLSEKYTTCTKSPTLPLNDPINIKCQTIKHVVSSTSEAKTSGIFLNIKTAIWIRRMLEELGHPQTIIPLKIDKSTAETFSNSTLKEKKRKVKHGTCGYIG